MPTTAYADPDLDDDVSIPVADGVQAHASGTPGVVIHGPLPNQQRTTGVEAVVPHNTGVEQTTGYSMRPRPIEVVMPNDDLTMAERLKVDFNKLTPDQREVLANGKGEQVYRQISIMQEHAAQAASQEAQEAREATMAAQNVPSEDPRYEELARVVEDIARRLPPAPLQASRLPTTAEEVRAALRAAPATAVYAPSAVSVRTNPEPSQKAVTEETPGLPFLTNPPSKPDVPVIIHSPAGSFRVKYHSVVKRGRCLSLVYDGRYDGDQFVPASTGDGQPLRIEVPSLDFDGQVMAFDFNSTIGCLEIVNLVIVTEPEPTA